MLGIVLRDRTAIAGDGGGGQSFSSEVRLTRPIGRLFARFVHRESSMQVDEAVVEAFVEKVLGDYAGANAFFMASIGDRLGLFRNRQSVQ